MAAQLDNVRFNPTAGGLTDWTYSSAVAGYQSPASAGAVNGRTYKYFAIDASNNWELGEGAYNTTGPVLPRTTIIASSTGSKINFASAPQVAIVLLKEDLISIEENNSFTATQKAQIQKNITVSGPTVQTFTTGTAATYTTPANCTWIEVYIVGAGGGGGGAGTASQTAGTAGGASTFNSINASGGGGGAAGATTAGGSANAAGGAGGTGGTGTATRRAGGADGENGSIGVSGVGNGDGGNGGAASGFGGGGRGAVGIGTAAVAGRNFGGGGGGGAGGGGSPAAGGGGGGEVAYLIINNPSATYTYTVGGGGASGTTGTSGTAAAGGAGGFVQVIEHFGS